MKKVIVFSTPTCSWCKKLKLYLKQNRIRYTEIDVSKNQRALKNMMRNSGQSGVPQMWVDNSPIVGFDKNKIDRVFGLKKLAR